MAPRSRSRPAASTTRDASVSPVKRRSTKKVVTLDVEPIVVAAPRVSARKAAVVVAGAAPILPKAITDYFAFLFMTLVPAVIVSHLVVHFDLVARYLEPHTKAYFGTCRIIFDSNQFDL